MEVFAVPIAWKFPRPAATAAAVLAMLAIAAPASAEDVEVDVELVLAVDISQSMDEYEQQVQRDGYVSALVSEEVAKAVAFGMTGKVAVTYIEWGGVGEQFVVADWQLIDGPQSAEAFANRLAEAPLKTVQRTSISSALAYAGTLFSDNGYKGARQVIDISGDGPNNQGGVVTASRDVLIAQGITINGLPLMLSDGASWYHLPNLDHYYEDCVIGGPGSFVVPVRSLDGFADAIRLKLVLEIAGLMDDTVKVVPAAGRAAVPCNMFD
ncbi:DUF1194 domain-containing protein [Pseudoxanthobacter sp. M-2]|uniref:DUF1194 domain-containing protein n=1 Tax=Pseudoxanthobacter sp. M-2 TaxID=3078754 RepID=UPI0038FC6517